LSQGFNLQRKEDYKGETYFQGSCFLVSFVFPFLPVLFCTILIYLYRRGQERKNYVGALRPSKKDEWCTEVVPTGRLSSVQRIHHELVSTFLPLLSPMLHPPKGPCERKRERNRPKQGD